MSKVKIIFFLILGFVVYKVFVVVKDFEIGVENKIVEIDEKAGFEREGEAIGLLMYVGDPPVLIEHLYTENRSKCLESKAIAEESSTAYYKCVRLKATLIGRKIAKVIEEIEVIE